MKHIDIIVKYFYPVTAGIEANIFQTHKYFLDKGWTVTVHASQDTLTERSVLAKTDNVEGIKVIRYHHGKFGFFPKIDWENTDVVSLHNFNIFPHFQVMLYVTFRKLLGKKKFVLSLTPHGGFNPEWRIFSKLTAFIKQVYHYTIGVILINASLDVVRAVSEWEHGQIASKGVSKNKIHTVINGAEDEAYLDVDKLASPEIKEKVKSYGRYILQIGRIYMIKNYETTIKALALLPKEINYVIAGPVGSETYKKKLEDLIEGLGLKDRVVFIGVVSGVDKYYLIKHAQMMVHMALWESFCNVVYEAMGQGLVCIVSDNTALRYLVKNNINGFRLFEKDYKGVAKKTRYVIENVNSKEIKEIRANNRKFGLAHSWGKVSDQIEKIYLLKMRHIKI